MFAQLRHAITAIVLGVAVLSHITPAQAVPQLKLTTSAGGTVTVVDGGVGDMNSAAGAVTFVGSLLGWTVNVSTGISKPMIGDGIRPKMDLNSINVSGGAGTITIEFSDNDWSLGLATASTSAIGGGTDGVVSYRVYTGADNDFFQKSLEITSQGPYTTAAFSGTAGGIMGSDASFSITQEVTITHSKESDVSSFNATVTVAEPGTLAIFGLGLMGLGVMQRRRKRTGEPS